MKKLVDAVRRWLVRGNREAGMVTAEYAIGTVAVVGLGGLIFKILTDPKFMQILWDFIQWLIKIIEQYGLSF